MNRHKVRDPPPLHRYWLFPPGPVTEVYYITLADADERPSPASLEKHIERAWAADAPVDDFCVARSGKGFWVQILGHANFRVIMNYLKNEGRFVGGGEVKIDETNETISAALLVNEYNMPHKHFAIYDKAEQRIQSDERVSPDVFEQPADTCTHVFAVRHDPRGYMCSACRAKLEKDRREMHMKLQKPKGSPDEGFKPNFAGNLVCVRHLRAGCRFCNRPRLYGFRFSPEELRG